MGQNNCNKGLENKFHEFFKNLFGFSAVELSTLESVRFDFDVVSFKQCHEQGFHLVCCFVGCGVLELHRLVQCGCPIVFSFKQLYISLVKLDRHIGQI